MEAIQTIQSQTIEMMRYSLLNQATDYLYSGQFDQVQETIIEMDQALRSLSGSSLHDTLLASHWIARLMELKQRPSPEKSSYPAGLTEREVEVLRLVASGATNQPIAAVLHISARTVNTHMTNILNKNGCENRTAASAFAVQHHLIP